LAGIEGGSGCFDRISFGSANTSLIVGKFYGVDVRKHGSGNAGMTNTLRTLGKFPAFLVILGDTLRGFWHVLLGIIFLKLVSIRQN